MAGSAATPQTLVSAADAVADVAAELLDPQPRTGAQTDGKSRWYVHPETGAEYLSVTFVTSRTNSKPWLAPWSAKLAAEYAVDFQAHWLATARDARQVAIANRENPDEAARDAAVDEIKRVAAAQRALKADVGTYVHDVIEALLLDTPIPGIPEALDGRIVEWQGEIILICQEWLDGILDGWFNFMADFDPEPIAAECTVASDEHEAAGTIDGLYRFRDARSPSGFRIRLVDVKTGLHLDADVLAQLGPYYRFPKLWLRNGMIVDKPQIDDAAVLHIRPSYSRGYKLLAVSQAELDLGWTWWQAARAQLHAGEEVPSRFGRAWYPPTADGTQPPPMVEDLTSYPGCSRAVAPLVDAGFEWLADVALLTRADVLAVKGVGPETVDALERVLAEHQHALQPPRRVEDLAAYPGAVRAVRPLQAAGHRLVADVTALRRPDLLRIKGLGPVAVDALLDVLRDLHLIDTTNDTDMKGGA